MSLHTAAPFLRTHRSLLGCATLLLAFALTCGATQAGAATFTVTNLTDTADGSCSVSDCSLREAITDANALDGDDTISFAQGVGGTIVLGARLPDITTPISITGPVASGITIDGNHACQAFFVKPTGNLNLSRLTLSHGKGPGGGAIYSAGALRVDSCTFFNNTADFGGAIYSQPASSELTTTINNSTFATNTAVQGGALLHSSGLLVIESCTISGNISSANQGSGIYTSGDITSSVKVHNSIIAGNASSDIQYNNSSRFHSDGYNLVGTGNGADAFASVGDQNLGETSPNLGSLADNGGPTNTMQPLAGSPAIDKGQTTQQSDQRDRFRPVDFPGIPNATGGDGADIGAFELNETSGNSASIVVTTLADHDDGVCGAIDCTLREAIIRANDQAGTDGISFKAGLAGTITLAAALDHLTGEVNITGPTVAAIAISGNHAFRAFQVEQGADVSIFNLTLQDGDPKTDLNYYGGAVLNLGSLLLENCTLSGNTAAAGGAIFNENSNLPESVLTIRNCTIAGNTASTGDGGGIYNTLGKIVIDSSTLSGNTAPQGTGNQIVSGKDARTSTTIGNSIVAGADSSHTDIDLVGTNTTNSIFSNGHNLIGDGSGAGVFTATGDQVIGDGVTGLAALASNGGPTQTMAITIASPAFNRGSTTLTTDQRGTARPEGAADDIGAFELADTGAPSITLTSPQTNGSASTIPPISGMATDDTGIASLTVSLQRLSDSKYWNGTAWDTTVTQLAPTLSGPVTSRTFNRASGLPTGSALVPGSYEATATAKDSFNFTLSVGHTFTVTPATRPAVTVVTPANNSYLKSLTVANGTVTDATGGPGIAKVEITLQRVSDSKYWNGSAWGATTTPLSTTLRGDGTWTRTNFPSAGPNTDTQIQEGKYILAATATDKASHTSLAGAANKSSFFVDTTVPSSITITEPAAGSTLKTLARITGTASDNIRVDQVLVALKRNSDGKFWTGTEWGAYTTMATNVTGLATQRTWAISTGLPTGANIAYGSYAVTAIAIDSAGNRSNLSQGFFVSESILPTGTVSSPANATTVSSLTQVTGTAEDTGGSGLAAVRLTLQRLSDAKFWTGAAWSVNSTNLLVNTTLVNPNSATWTCTALPGGANLADGVYRAVAVALDKAGNTSRTFQSQFALKRTAPLMAPQTKASKVVLSSAAASTSGTIELVFTGALGTSATDVLRYSAVQNGEPVEVLSAQQKSPGVILLAANSLVAGAKFAVSYALQDSSGDMVAGTANTKVR